MRIVSVLHANRRVLAAGLIGIVAFAGGCDSGGNVGESTAAPEAPPPGKSGAERKAVLEKAHGTSAPGAKAPRKTAR
jgi:hypothetical protein